MIFIDAADYGIKDGQYITRELEGLLSHIKSIKGDKTLTFPKGTYYINGPELEKRILYITNTTGDNEYGSDETPHLNSVAIYLEGISDLILDARDSVFVIDGKATNIALIGCERVTLKSLEIRHSHPHMHDMTVIRKNAFSVDFKLDKDTLYEFRKGKMYFYGKDYREPADKNANFSWWNGLIRRDTPDKIERVLHPLHSKLRIKDLGSRKIRVYYLNTSRFRIGDRFCVYDVRRQYAGIFIDRSKDIILEDIKQRFNYSLALVAQDSENITLDRAEFAPEKDSPRKLSSVADFIQLCMCRGKATVKDSYFDGAGDDCLNVHGIHLSIKSINGNKITVRFMHPQTHGFNPLRKGDEIAFINPRTMLEDGRAFIEESELINEQEILLTLSSTEKAVIGNAIEDISACPALEFSGNTATRIITRGLLITTREKVTVENNRFCSTTMSGILLSDDAMSWYESGMCCDVTIRNNIFDYCGEAPILIKPENKVHAGAVHKNISIIGNTFRKYEGPCFSIKSSDNVLLKNNLVLGGEYLKTENCTNVREE